jgi:hypothetical protein
MTHQGGDPQFWVDPEEPVPGPGPEPGGAEGREGTPAVRRSCERNSASPRGALLGAGAEEDEETPGPPATNGTAERVTGPPEYPEGTAERVMGPPEYPEGPATLLGVP